MPSTIPSDFIQELLARVDIVDVINASVPLVKSGREYKACCPFHNEKTPSFFVNPAKQFYHCFGCGESGTAISFLMKYRNLQFRETIEELASIAGMEIPVDRSRRPSSGDFERLLELMTQVQSAYKHELHRGEHSSSPRDYLKSREISREAALKFGIGYAPDRWDFLLKKFGRNAQDCKLLEKAGLVTSKEKGKFYDRFRDRLMFPITDRRGRVIGFGGRIIGSGEPKYLNSPETLLFKKSNELFGLHEALTAIKQAGKVLVVEGYTDVVALSQSGVENVVATLGTATTPFHVRALFQTAPEIVFCFDGDAAGRTAAWRAMESALPMMYDGKLVSFVFLPQGHDPDSMIREEGKEKFLERISSGEPITDFIFRILLENTDMNRHDGKAKLVEDFKPLYSKLPDSTLRQLMLTELVQYTGLTEGFILSRLLQEKSNARDKTVEHRSSSIGDENQSKLTTRALAAVVQNPQLVLLLQNKNDGMPFQDINELEKLDAPNTRLLVVVLGMLAVNPEMTTATLVERFRGTNFFDLIMDFVSMQYDISEQSLEQEFEGIMSKLGELVQEQKHKEFIARVAKGEATEEEVIGFQKEMSLKAKRPVENGTEPKRWLH